MAARAGCECDRDARIGDAGRIIGGDPTANVSVLDAGGEQQSLPGRCLTVHATKTMLVRYLASLNGGNERTISDALYEATTKFAKTDVRWKNLEKTSQQLFGDLELFTNVIAKLGQPLVVPTRSAPADDGPVVLASVSEGDLNFQYGTPKLESSAGRGLGVHGPYDQGQERHDVLRAVVVAPEEFAAEAKKLRNILTQGLARFKGMKQRYRLRGFECELQSFSGTTRAAYENAVATASRGGFDIVLFVTKYDFRYAPRGENPYLAAKTVLASAGIASQAVTIEVLHQPENSLQWSSDSVALAAYTKVGNIPYVLHDPVGGRELVLGIGRSDVYD